MDRSVKREVLPLLVLAAMFTIAVWMWPRVPAVMPVHWNLSGQPNRLGGRFEGLFALPLAALALYLVLLVIPRIDPRRDHYAAFAGTYRAIRTLLVLMMLGLQLLMIASIERPTLSAVALPVLYGLIFVALGNYLPKVQSNWFVGVRTPWTLSSELSWRRTHRLAGWLFVIGGSATIIIAVIAPAAGMRTMLITLGATAITSVVYSYVVWRNDPHRMQTADLK